MFSLQIKITNIKKSIPYNPKQQIIAYYPLYNKIPTLEFINKEICVWNTLTQL